MAYPVSWPVIVQTKVRRERWPGGYKTRTTPLVYPGQEVLPDQPVMRLEHDEQPDGVGQSLVRLSLPSTTGSMKMKAIQAGLQHPGQASGAAEVLPAGMHGQVMEITRRGGVVIEGHAAVLQGVLGAGNQIVGILTLWSPGVAGQVIPPGAILAVPGPLSFMMLRQAMASGVVGIVASSMQTRDLEGFLAVDLVDLLNGNDVALMQAHLPPITLLLTEGLGSVTMSTQCMNLLSRYQGAIALLSGVTSVRHRIVPELVISLPDSQLLPSAEMTHTETLLDLGAQVRICGGDYEGKTGIIDYFFTHQQTFASSVRARAVRLRLEDGSLLVVPVALIERIG